MRRRTHLAAWAAALILLPCAPAWGTSWPQAGGGPGRSGFQPAGDAGAPVSGLWAAPGDASAPPVISASGVVAFATADGRVHLLSLETGRPVAPPAVLSSSADGLVAGAGLVHAVHRGAIEVAVAVVDEASGAVLRDEPVAGTAGHRVRGPVTASGPALLFITVAPDGAEWLHRVQDGIAESVRLPGAGARAGLAVVWLGLEPYAVAGTTGRLLSYSLARFPAPGPAVTAGNGPSGAPAVPEGSGPGITPSVFVAVAEGAATRVHRLTAGLVTAAAGPPLPGLPGPGLAVSQEILNGVAGAGFVVAGTSQGLWALDARTLAPVGPPVAGSFAASAPVAVGGLGAVMRDDGSPVLVDLQAGRPAAGFTPHPAQAASTRPAMQPAASRGIVLLATDRGLFAYRTRCGNPVGGTARDDRLDGTATGDLLAGHRGEDMLLGGDGDDCLDGGPGADDLRGDDGDDVLAGANAGDRLDGGPGADELLGGPGADLLLGGSGADRLAGGRGADRIDAGPGADAVNVRGGGRDRVRCGPGRDVVLADRQDRVLPDCERILRR